MDKNNSHEIVLSPCVRLFLECLLEEEMSLNSAEPKTPTPAQPAMISRDELAMCG